MAGCEDQGQGRPCEKHLQHGGLSRWKRRDPPRPGAIIDRLINYKGREGLFLIDRSIILLA
jgi:hypothetical protein